MPNGIFRVSGAERDHCGWLGRQKVGSDGDSQARGRFRFPAGFRLAAPTAFPPTVRSTSRSSSTSAGNW